MKNKATAAEKAAAKKVIETSDKYYENKAPSSSPAISPRTIST